MQFPTCKLLFAETGFFKVLAKAMDKFIFRHSSDRHKLFLLILLTCFFPLIHAQESSPLAELKLMKTEADSLVEIKQSLSAVPLYEKVLKEYEELEIGDEAFFFELLVDFSYAYAPVNLSNAEKQRMLLEQAQEILDPEKVSAYSLSVYYQDMASLERQEGNYEGLLGYARKSNEIALRNREKIIEQAGLQDALKNEAYSLQWNIIGNMHLRNEESLLEAHQKLVDFDYAFGKKADISVPVSEGHFYVGRYYQNSNPDQAVFYFDKAIAATSQSYVKFYANICKGFSYLNAKEYRNTEKMIAVLESDEELGTQQQLNVHELAARCYSETGNIDKLVFHTNEALTLMNEKEIPIDVRSFSQDDFEPFQILKYPVLLSQFASFLEGSGESDLVETSRKLFEKGLQQFADRIDHNPIGYHLNIYEMIQKRMLGYLSSVKTFASYKRELLQQMEQIETKARMNQLLANRVLANNPSALDAQFKKESELREMQTYLKKNNAEEDSALSQELFDIELQLAEISEQIREKNQAVYELTNTAFDFSQLSLPEGTQVYKYIVAEDQLFVVAVHQADIRVWDLGTYAPIQESVTAYLEQIKGFGPVEELAASGEALYTKLLPNFRASASTVIIADQALRYLPFELLKTDTGYLIEQTAISYENGLTYLKEDLYPTVAHTEAVSFFAPSYQDFMASPEELAVRGEEYDLQGAKEEVAVLSRLTGGDVYADDEASKASFLNLSNQYSVIHLAGHAYLDDKDPELSNLVFSDHEENNRLYISELYGLRSNAELAVLSACNTGVGGMESGKGVVSLSEAFMYAGIPSTVSSLWSAPDQATKEIMISFYGYLKEGLPKSSALQQAKLDYLKNTSNDKLKHPYYWAAFVLYGNDAPVDLSSSQFPWYYGVLILLVLGFLGYFFWRRSKGNVA